MNTNNKTKEEEDKEFEDLLEKHIDNQSGIL